MTRSRARAAGKRPQRVGSVRIIGGEHRGRRLQFTEYDGDLRPSGDRVRETLFSWLQFELQGARVLDLFAGSGVLAAEAMSRGAASATVLEKNHQHSASIRRQLEAIFAERPVEVRCADALAWLRESPVSVPYDVVFVDPPYDMQLAEPACALLQASGWLAPDACIYVESRRASPAPVVPSCWQLEKEKHAGDVRACLYRAPSEGAGYAA